MDLKEWTESYISYLDSFKKNLKTKSIRDDIIDCDYSDKGKLKYIVSEKLEEASIEDDSVIVCLNTKENLDVLIKKWKDFITFQKLKIIFSNPKLNLQWSIIPYLHDKYGDPDSLKTGLNSLFGSVPRV